MYCIWYKLVLKYSVSFRNPPVSDIVWRDLLQDLLDMQQNVYTCLQPATCHQVFNTTHMLGTHLNKKKHLLQHCSQSLLRCKQQAQRAVALSRWDAEGESGMIFQTLRSPPRRMRSPLLHTFSVGKLNSSLLKWLIIHSNSDHWLCPWAAFVENGTGWRFWPQTMNWACTEGSNELNPIFRLRQSMVLWKLASCSDLLKCVYDPFIRKGFDTIRGVERVL